MIKAEWYSKRMSPIAFFVQNALPVFNHLSSDSKRQLELYLAEGNTAFRQKKLLEFFKTVDWVSEEEIQADRLLQKLPPSLRRQLNREIADYLASKATTRAESAQKREEYRLRIFEYFRIKLPAADKSLLESLRDYELDLTGRDVNWRHYFTLDSFKKIDAFLQALPDERQALFAKFKQDVDTYKKNYDKVHHAQAQNRGEPVFTFDDWCELMGDEIPRSQHSKANAHTHRQQSIRPDNAVVQAYKTLQVALDASPDTVKRQFRKLTLEHHPDLPTGSEEKMKTIVTAYHALQRYWETSMKVY
jgi:hypothetical protein